MEDFVSIILTHAISKCEITPASPMKKGVTAEEITAAKAN